MTSISGGWGWGAEYFGNGAKCDRAINIYFLRGGTTLCMSRISATCKHADGAQLYIPRISFNILCLISTFNVIIAITKV